MPATLQTTMRTSMIFLPSCEREASWQQTIPAPPAIIRSELPPLHSITSWARASSLAGTSRPSVFAVFRLITSSTLVDC